MTAYHEMHKERARSREDTMDIRFELWVMRSATHHLVRLPSQARRYLSRIPERRKKISVRPMGEYRRRWSSELVKDKEVIGRRSSILTLLLFGSVLSVFDKATTSPVHILAALSTSELITTRRAARETSTSVPGADRLAASEVMKVLAEIDPIVISRCWRERGSGKY